MFLDTLYLYLVLIISVELYRQNNEQNELSGQFAAKINQTAYVQIFRGANSLVNYSRG